MKLLSLLALLFLFACNNDAKKQETGSDTTVSTGGAPVEEIVPDRSLAGRWKPVQVEVASMSEEEKQDLMDHAIIEFTGTGEISTTMKDNKRSGTYMFSEQDSKLHTKLGNKEEKFDISWDRELLKMKNEDGTVTLKRIP